MNWRAWVYSRLTTDPTLTAVVPSTAIFGAGALVRVPRPRPFLVILMSNVLSGLRGDDQSAATSQQMSVAVHDKPGDYQRIDSVIEIVRARLESEQGLALGGGITAQWQGVGPDSADDQMGTLVKMAEFRLIGRG